MKTKYQIPKTIKEIMMTITNNGYNAFIVGGYVRDLLIGKNALDIDITTNAPFDILKRLFKGKTYKEYGSIHLKVKSYNIDITTFREELEYKDNKPVKIAYTNKLYNDLLRRDFTINTLVIDINGNLLDLLDSIKDLNNKTIKVVGNTYERFEEDKTRILRALRFFSTLNFKLDNEIENYLKEKPHNLKTLKKEYIKNELQKIFEKPNKEFFELIKKYNLKQYLYINYEKINLSVSSSYSIWAQIETTLPFKKEDKLIIQSIKKIISKQKIEKIDIYTYGEQISKYAAEILNQNIDNIIIDMPIRTIFDIDITYKEIIEITKTNSVNKIYKDLEKQILYDKIENKNEEIKNYLRGKYE